MKKFTFLFLLLLGAVTLCYSQVTVATRRADGVMLLNGAPFYPNGIYHVSWYSTNAQMAADMKLIGQSGFNCVHVGYDGSAFTTAYLDTAFAYGVRVILEGQIYGTPKAINVATVNLLKNHPALIGWSIGDDVHNNTTTAQLQAFHTQMKSLDPNHLTFFTVYDPNQWNAYFGIGDYIMPYSYPINAGDPLGWVNRQMTLARAQNKPMLGLPQAFSWTGNQAQAPSALEYRNMAYQNLINNVRGMLPYTFTESGNTGNYLPANTGLWNAVKSVNAQINTLKNVFTDGVFTSVNTGYQPYEGIQSSYWVYNNQLYIVVANLNTSGSINASITLPPGTTGPAVALFAGQPTGMTFNNTTRILSGAVTRRHVHVYRLNKAAMRIANNLPAETVKTVNNIRVYPNPVMSQFIIENVKAGASITVFSAEGKMVHTLKAVRNRELINVTSWGKGTYFINIINGKEKTAQEIVIK